MGLWLLLLLLHFQLVLCVLLPAPLDVSISSFNLEHTLSFLPGPHTPSDANFTVQVLHSRKNSWRPVAACLELKAGQICNLTKTFKDLFDHYRARVQAVTPNKTSNWTMSRWFQPVSDTVLGPPDLSVSGCGNCLILQLRLPASTVLRQNLQLKDLYRELVFHVQRTRDGTQFRLNLPYEEETVITYLQPGVEYCVTVSVTSLFNSNTVPSKPQCAFTSPPSSRSSLPTVFSLMGVFSVLAFLFLGLVVYGSQLSFKLLRRRIPRTLRSGVQVHFRRGVQIHLQATGSDGADRGRPSPFRTDRTEGCSGGTTEQAEPDSGTVGRANSHTSSRSEEVRHLNA